MGFSRQEYWSGLPFPSPGDLPNPGIEPVSLLSPALAGGFFTTSTTREAPTLQAESKGLPSEGDKSTSPLSAVLPEEVVSHSQVRDRSLQEEAHQGAVQVAFVL